MAVSKHWCCPACAAGRQPFTEAHVVAWMGSLVRDDGGSFELEPFQRGFVGDLFGFTVEMSPAECWLVVPEGNGKTTLVAALALYYLNHVSFANIPVAASALEQSQTLYLQMEGFVLRTEWMVELVENVVAKAKAAKRQQMVPRFECLSGYRTVRYHLGGAVQIKAADERTGDGVIPRGLAIVDEGHRHRDLGLYRTWSGKCEKTRAQLVMISTAGEPGGEFEELRASMRIGDVVDRSETHLRAWTPSGVLHEWAVPEDGDVDDLELVAAANPLSTITPVTLARKRGAKSWTLDHWRRFTCNLPTRGLNAAISELEWAQARSEETIPEGEPVAVGLDVGRSLDTTAIVPLWWRSHEERLLGQARILQPPQDGTMLPDSEIKRALEEVQERNPVHTLVMDMSLAASLAEWAETELGCVVVEHSQKVPQKVADFDAFMEALRQGWLRHDGHEELTRHVLNAVARLLPGGDSCFDRPTLSRHDQIRQRLRVIDGLVAAAMVNMEMEVVGGGVFLVATA